MRPRKQCFSFKDRDEEGASGKVETPNVFTKPE